MSTKINNTKLLGLILFIIIAISAMVLTYQSRSMHVKPNIHGFILPTPKTLKPFKTIDQTGQAFTEKNLQHHWSLLFFGFTNCGFICPTTLSRLNQFMQQLKAKNISAKKIPTVIMVSVDPARDTVKKMRQYLHSFNPSFIGLRAPMTETLALQKQFNVVAVKLSADDHPKQYTINHSADIMLIAPSGKMVALLNNPAPAKQLLQDYLKIVA